MTFNKDRFANFAKYDLTINKAFFRNMALVTLAGAVSIALMGFMLRYNIYRETLSTPYAEGMDETSFEHYNWVYITASYELGFIILMTAIFAGCWAHNLRNKQGRITELTLPATNLEKFIWHALLTLAGGFVVSLAAMLVADGINALLTLMMFGADNGVASLTATAARLVTFSTTAGNVFGIPTTSDLTEEDLRSIQILHASSFAIVASAILNTAIYFFGNALKYKYNIILTFVILQVISTIGSFIFFFATAFTAGSLLDNMGNWDFDGDEAFHFIVGSIITAGVLMLLLSACSIWWSYRRYTKAQITSPFNK